MTQLAGAAFLGFGTLALLARSSDSKEFRLALATGLFVQDAIGTIVSILGQLSGFFNPLGWSTVAVYLLLAIGYGYFRFLNPEAS
jgi:nucleoside recognition membrane protein YjiH